MKEKLNLGCGNDIRADYLNLDLSAIEGIDVVHDLNMLPLPFFWNWILGPVFSSSSRVQQYYEAIGLVYIFPAQNLRVVLEK